MSSAGKQIAWLLDRYCQDHGAQCTVVKVGNDEREEAGIRELG
jgi:hypothetical protein